MQRASDDALLNETLEAIAGFVTDPYDYVALTYVAAGNGVGELETAIFKTGGSGGVTVATITITYDANDQVSTITSS